ncbi:MAG TPA: FAD-binding oxidoreductase [Candidatus Competibacteraceae bacterium]|nr:FAD-binding oxidoreductase [Candidatus Competibacteraceae bacterium]
MSRSPHIPSYYAATANPAPACPVLEGAREADICVVGAGIAGLSTALSLAERGYRVVVLEAERIGWGASGRSGGQIINGYACDLGRLEAQLGRDDARRLWDMSVEAVELVARNVERYHIDCDFQWGLLHAALKPRQRRYLLAWQERMAHHYGYPHLRLVEGEELARLIASRRYLAALHDPGSGHLHPLNYTLGLGHAALAAGVEIFEGSRVLRLEHGARPLVHTERGQVRGAYIALCANAYLPRRLAPRLWRRIMPVGTYVATTEPLGEERARALLPSNAAVSDLNFVLDYFRRTHDHRLLFGGLVSYSTLPPLNLEQRLRAHMVRVFPQLEDVRMEFGWGGLVDITLNRAPDFGRLADNVFYLQGFSGHGMALANLAGKVLAEAIAGQAERLDLFARLHHRPFPGGRWLRTPALVLAMLYYRLRDLLP